MKKNMPLQPFFLPRILIDSRRFHNEVLAPQKQIKYRALQKKKTGFSKIPLILKKVYDLFLTGFQKKIRFFLAPLGSTILTNFLKIRKKCK